MDNHIPTNYLSSRSTTYTMHNVAKGERNLRFLLDVAYSGDPYFSNV